MVTRRKPQPLIFIAAALAVFITAIWQQRAGSHEQREGAGTAYRDSAATTGSDRQARAPAAPRESAPAASRDAQMDSERAQIEATLELIARGGPFPHEKDGSIFSNREGRLPARERGYYREYTVPTPGAKNRGARRIVRGKGGETYYTSDHYKTFTRID